MLSDTQVIRTGSSAEVGSCPCATATSYSCLAAMIDRATVWAVIFGKVPDPLGSALADLSNRPPKGNPNIPPEEPLGRSAWEEMAQEV